MRNSFRRPFIGEIDNYRVDWFKIYIFPVAYVLNGSYIIPIHPIIKDVIKLII